MFALAAVLLATLASAGGELVVTGQVLSVHKGSCVLRVGQDRLSFFAAKSLDISTGDIVAMRYYRAMHLHGGTTRATLATEVLGHGPTPPVLDTTIEALCRGENDRMPVRIRGTVADIAEDDVDPDYRILVVRSGTDSITLPLSKQDCTALRDFSRLPYAEVELTGVCYRDYPTGRFYKGPVFVLHGDDAIRIVRPAPADIFDNPSLPFGDPFAPDKLTALGLRTAVGRVVAVWGGNKFLLKVRHKMLRDGVPLETDHCVELPYGIPAPTIGATVQVAGQPETDTFHINLSRACWRTADAVEAVRRPPVPATISADGLSLPNLDSTAYGQLVRFQGLVTSLPRPGASDARMRLSVEGTDVAVDASACPDVLNGLLPGTKVEITGIRLFDIDNWRPAAPLPKIKNLFVALRLPSDVIVLSRPSWWTTGRLAVLVAGLMALLAGAVVWNRTLNRLVTRRGRELAREQIEHALTELKVGERTRLAVELHDSLSQNLAGIACQVGALKNNLNDDPSAVRPRILTVERMLESTRSELRNCLFDLRSDVMDEPDFTHAIRKTLDETDIGAEITIRFNVPRKALLDTTAHAIIAIVRELAGNAYRHGHATKILIAGSREDGRLRFSVRDNGCGFDPRSAPGIADGHFGLDGIRNRTEALNGSFSISSDPKTGTRAVVEIPIPAARHGEPA